MEPRISTSRKWTPLPKELATQIRSVFQQNFKEQLGRGTVETEGKIFPDEILISVGFREQNRLKQANFAVSIAYKRDKDNVLKLLHLAVDASAALFEQYFAAEDDSEFPRQWTEVDFEGRKIFVEYNTLNSDLETKANQILGVDEADKVTQGDWEDDDESVIQPEHIKAHLGLGEEDPEDDEGH